MAYSCSYVAVWIGTVVRLFAIKPLIECNREVYRSAKQSEQRCRVRMGHFVRPTK